MRYAIYGAGALGTVIGASLTKSGIDLELIEPDREHAVSLKTRGAHIAGTVEMTVPVRAVTPDEMLGTYDAFFLMTSQSFNGEVVSRLKPFLTKDGAIVTFQNGIPEPGIAELMGWNRTIGCIANWDATFTAWGECTLNSRPDELSFQLGRSEGVSEPLLAQIKSLLERLCPVYTEDNILGARWSKLLLDTTFSGLNTALGGFGDLTEDKRLKKLAVQCMKECADVCRAVGQELVPVQGKNLISRFDFESSIGRRMAELKLPAFMKKYCPAEPTMLRNLKSGRPCRIEEINGVVCDWGRRCGVLTPINDCVVEIIRRAQAGEMTLCHENIRCFPGFSAAE